MRHAFVILSSLFLFSYSYSFSSKAVDKKTAPQENQMKLENIKSDLIHLKKINHESPFKKGFAKVLNNNPSFSKLAISNAFVFLNSNYKNLKKENLCFAKTNTKNREQIRNLKCLIIADYSSQKTTPRLLFINPQTGDSEIFLTAHGKGSNRPEERETGLKTSRYSNVSGSNMTSLGYYLTDFLITSKKKTFGPGPNNGLMLDGISCTNTNARQRQIVAHTAMYVPEIDKLASTAPKVGNSEGCVTIPSTRKDVLKTCEHGALVYAFDNLKKHLTQYKKK